jgi:hypothetical protein
VTIGICSPLFLSGGIRPSAADLALAFSDIAAFQRNYFRFHELMGIGGTAQPAFELCGLIPARFFYCAAQSSLFISPPAEGKEMSAGLFRIESSGLADSGGVLDRPAAKLFKNKLIWLSVILVVAAGAWKVFSEDTAGRAKGQTVGRTNFATTASIQPSPWSDTDPALSAPQLNAAPAAAPAEAAPVDGLKISSQSWRRGGLGSKALITLTLRNDNDYAIGDIGILCSFSRADGNPVTERRQTIHDTVKKKSRKTFARMHVGFINVTADRATCSLLTASRV